MKKVSYFLLFSLAALRVAGQDIPPSDSVVRLMKKVAAWQLENWKTEGMRAPKWDWTNAAAYTGFMALDKVSSDSNWRKAMYGIAESINWLTGPRKMMADDYCVAQLYAALYQLYHEPKMIASFMAQADSISLLPHTDSLTWQNDIQLREWAWCDALFMGPPAFAYLTAATGKEKYLATACRLWWKTTDYLFDKKEALYFRDSRYFTQREANGRKVFWARGNGWVMAGLVRLLENMPENYPGRARFVRLFRKMSARIASLQQPDGTWHASLLDPASYPSKETSGTGFYCYALAWGVNHHLLSLKKYHPCIAAAWKALSACVDGGGRLGYVQKIGDKPGQADAQSTGAFGTGAFLLAGSEVAHL